MTKLTIVDAVNYETRASWWAEWISIEWMQEVAARWFVWKVRRKYRRYEVSLERQRRTAEARS